MAESMQHVKGRVRPDRVHITYDVQTNGALELKELPFVMGVLGDFSGNPAQPLEAMKERKFIEINPDNFDDVLKGMKPRLAFSVENKLNNDGGQVKVELKFESMDDFSPERVAAQVGPLKELLDLRTRLSDLRGSLQGNDKLDDMLFQAISNTEQRDQLKAELGTGTPAAEATEQEVTHE